MGGMKRMNSFAILNTIIILGMIIAAVSLLFIEDLLPSIIAMSIMGSFLALEFLLLKAPDVALAEAAVGAILTPIIFIVTLKKVKDKKDNKEEEK
jgi:energy-converting hydrogenase B subunit D